MIQEEAIDIMMNRLTDTWPLGYVWKCKKEDRDELFKHAEKISTRWLKAVQEEGSKRDRVADFAFIAIACGCSEKVMKDIHGAFSKAYPGNDKYYMQRVKQVIEEMRKPNLKLIKTPSEEYVKTDRVIGHLELLQQFHDEEIPDSKFDQVLYVSPSLPDDTPPNAA